jgi:hypothetical protein
LLRKTEFNDLTGWMDDAQTPPGALRIGLAHGAVLNFTKNCWRFFLWESNRRPDEESIVRPTRLQTALAGESILLKDNGILVGADGDRLLELAENRNSGPVRRNAAGGHHQNFTSALGILQAEPSEWPAPGSEDTELGVLMEPGAGHTPDFAPSYWYGGGRYYFGEPGFAHGRWNGGSYGPCWTYTPIGRMWNCG